MQPDYQQSVDFLAKLAPNGPWTLTSVNLDKTEVRTQTFTAQEPLLAWLQEHGADRNIYYALNPLRRPVQKKASREDVASLSWLHVDLDPRAGEDLQAEQARARGLLNEPPASIPPPTVVVFSGGGFQALWKLAEPMRIDGREELYEEAKRYNLQLELIFGADHCHNVDRIMRLPGTLNRPDKKKRDKGRKITLATLEEWHEDRIYPLDEFTPAPVVQAGNGGSGFNTSANRVEIPGNVVRVNDLGELPSGVSDLAKVVIAQGHDPDDLDRFPSRSEAVFFVCCELIRAEVPDETIYSILTDADWKISESILEKGSNIEGYAARQIGRAHEHAIDPHLLEMNERHAVIGNMGGRCRVVEEVWDPLLKRHRLSKQTFEDIRNRYMSEKVQIGTNKEGDPVHKPLGKWWLEHESRRAYEGIIFAPGRSVSGHYNLWQGFAFDSLPGDKHERFLEHIHENVCAGNDDHFNYVMGWSARAVQYPDSPGQTAIVLRGDQGVGKGFMAKTLGQLFGRHYVHVSNSQHLTGNFNYHLRDCVLLFADEAFYANDKKHASVLKTLVTEDCIMVEPKGVDSEMVANCLHMIMASNEDWVVPAGWNERRFCVLDVSSKMMQRADYFGKIAQDLESGGFQNLLHYLMSYDLKNYNVRQIPNTEALQQQKMFSMTSEEEWWYNKLVDGRILYEHEGWVDEVSIEALLADYISYTRQFNLARRGNATRLGQFMHRAMPKEGFEKKQRRETITIMGADGLEKSIVRPYVYTIPSLQDCRDAWDRKFGGPYKWPIVEEADSPVLEDTPF